MSPTYSWMINMIDQEFVINKELLRQYFFLEENKEKGIQILVMCPKCLGPYIKKNFMII